MTVFLLIHTFKSVKNIGNTLLLYSLARILHHIPHTHPVKPQTLTADGKGNGAFAGVFQSII